MQNKLQKLSEIRRTESPYLKLNLKNLIPKMLKFDISLPITLNISKKIKQNQKIRHL
jgi:hypothetical protein